MKLSIVRPAVAGALLISLCYVRAEVSVVVEHHDNKQATHSFSFKTIARPSRGHHVPPAVFSIVEGRQDENSGGLVALGDSSLPQEEDAPAENFFFGAGTAGGRLLMDLGGRSEVKEVNTFSWHPGARASQVYRLYASDSLGAAFDARPRRGTDPANVGWKLLATVDTRSAGALDGGQFGVHIFDTGGNLGAFRYLLFDMSATETADPFGNTFYSEIDVVDPNSRLVPVREGGLDCTETLEIGNGAYRIRVDTCDTPDLQEWAKTALFPVLIEWYPKLVGLLPSQGFEAPKELSIQFSERTKGVAETSGTRIKCAAKWFRTNLKGEAVGSVVHELVHVVQRSGNARRTNPNASRPPGWLVEGIADYLRWFLYEPQSHGADIVWMRQRKNMQFRYDAGYRVTANFLNWVGIKYDQDIVGRLNAAMRQGAYGEELWKNYTGRSLLELGDEWKQVVTEQIAPSDNESNSH